MNEVLKTIKERRSCRNYTTEQISDAQLNTILEAGSYAPSGMNKQSPIFIAIQDKEVIAQLSKINSQLWGKGPDGFFGAPTIIAVLANPQLCHTYQLDAMAAVENMLLAAQSLGLGAACISRAKDGFASEYGKALMAKLGIDPAYEGVEHVIVGYRNGDTPQAPPRREGRIFRI